VNNKKQLSFAVMALLGLLGSHAQALQIVSLSPQGEIAGVRQVVAKFDESAVNFGDPKAPAPLTIGCSDAQATKGSGRWVNDREWAYDFERDLPPGVSCTVQVRAGFKSPKGADLTSSKTTSSPSAGTYRFNTGGPFVRSIRPYPDSRIDEEQFFVLQLNGAATLTSVQTHVWCAVSGLGERVPVKLIEGADRLQLLKSQGLDKAAAAEPLSFVTLACNRRLTPSSNVQIVYGKGVATPALASGSGVPNSVEKRFNYQVREPFAASFNCERENAQSACLPIRPLSLNFNAPVPRKLAEGIRLVGAKETLKPVFGKEDGDSESIVNNVTFQAVLPEQTQFTLELPKDFKDASNRTLRNADSFPLKVATGAMPPLAKFAAAPFGIVERFAEPNGVAMLPVTLRNVEAALQVKGLQPGAATTSGKVSDLQPKTDADIIAWFAKVQHYDNYAVSRKQRARCNRACCRCCKASRV